MFISTRTIAGLKCARTLRRRLSLVSVIALKKATGWIVNQLHFELGTQMLNVNFNLVILKLGFAMSRLKKILF